MQLTFLGGPGEMARRIREFNWTDTLSAPEGWPPTLKAMVRIALTTRYPIFIFWGPRHICLYNDAYRASLGPEKHPAILGAPGRDAWPEIWDVIGPQIDMVMRGEGATWHENQLVPILRHGELQDVYWTYSYGPIHSEASASGVGGVLVICNETTRQIATAQRLADDRARLARLFEQAPGFMAMLSGPEHVIKLANPAYLRLIGYRDIVGRPVAEALPEAASQGFIDLLNRVYETGEAFTASEVSYRPRHADGSTRERYIDFVYQPITNETGDVIGIFVEGSDVTERREAYAALRKSQAELQLREQQLRLATAAGEIGLWDLDLVTETMHWPDGLKATLGVTTDAAVSMCDFYAAVHSADRERVSAAFEATLDPELRGLYDVEFRMVGKTDRRIRWIAAKGRGIFDEQGRCVRAIGTAMDVTARKADEVRLRELNEALERRVAEEIASKKVLADIVEGTNAFVQVADLQYRWLAINKASADEFERIYGVRPRAGDSMLELLRAQPEHQAEVAAIWGRALAGEESTALGEFGDPGRDRRHYEMRFNCLRDKDGKQVGAYQFVYDVTERVRDQERLARAEEALRQAQKMEAIGQLTGGIAHDFNNVLHAIQGSLQLIRLVPADPRVTAWADTALRSIKRGAELTAQLLTFARQQQLEPQTVVASRLLDDMEELLKRSVGPLAQLEMNLLSADATVTVDPTQLEMAVLNLAINARDAMPEGGVVRVTTRVRQVQGHDFLEPGTYVEIEVTDTGAGMPADVAARAFDPFFTTKGIGKGTGLGLSQVYGMAKQAGGGAFLQSALGQGTTVLLMLPQSGVSTAEVPRPSPATLLSQGQPRSMILVVDDDQDVRNTLTQSLDVLGYDVAAAPDGLSALRTLEKLLPDLMIVDFAMPGMTGAEVANHARARHTDLPIIFASGYADTTAIEKAAGATATILRKPFNIEALQQAIRHSLKFKTDAD